MNYSISS